MSAAIKSAISTLLLAVATGGAAQAAVLDLGLNGANVFSIGNFTSSGSDTQGSIVAGGDVTLQHYSINLKDQDAYGNPGYALIAGGNLNFYSGSIKNGDTYVNGTSSVTSASVYSPIKSGTSPVSLSALASSVKSTSTALSHVAATGTAAVQYGGLDFTGTKSAVEVFNVSGSDFSSVTYYDFSHVSKGSTVILNISGASDSMNGGLDSFSGYNVLFNFYQAQNLTINTGVKGSILAPLASVSGGSGVVAGNIVVGNWNTSVQINSNHYFDAVNVQGFTAAVPEPETYAMLLAGLGLVGMAARRRKARA